jgi:hypothetical protein
MRWVALTFSLIAVGCFCTSQKTNTIFRGQTIPQAEKIANKAGYQVLGYHDGSPVGGVYAIRIPLPDDRALLALHDPQSGWIYGLEIVENWRRPASQHVVSKVDRFELPATRPTAR